MTMNDFSSTLYDQTTNPSLPLPSAHEIATDIVRRDQRRIRLLAILCLLLWVAAVAGMVLMVVGLNEFLMGVRLGNARRFIQPAVQSDSDTMKSFSQPEREPSSEAAKDGSGDRQPPTGGPRIYWDDGTGLFHHTLPVIIGSMIFLFLAGATTVLLIFSSRRTTLTRINLNLAQIAEQLKALSRSATPAARDSLAASTPPSSAFNAGTNP
jgi:hypothetical protein